MLYIYTAKAGPVAISFSHFPRPAEAVHLRFGLRTGVRTHTRPVIMYIIILLGETCTDHRVQGDSLRVNQTIYAPKVPAVLYIYILYFKRSRPNTVLVPISTIIIYFIAVK